MKTLIASALSGRTVVLAAIIIASLTPAVRGVSDVGSPARGRVPTARLASDYGSLPLSFEANHGQSAPNVRFLARGSGYSLFLTSTEAVLRLNRTEPDAVGAVLRMTLLNANPGPTTAALDRLPGTSNYFVGGDPAQWRSNVPRYRRVQYEGVYPGVDLLYYGNQGQLEYDFVVAPGGSPSRITLAFDGASDVRIDEQGDLVLAVAGGEVRQHKPVVYQMDGGVRQPVAAGYILKGKHRVGFEVDAYDPARPLVIDPVLVYSTYLGGSAGDFGRGIAVDAAGNAYVVGFTGSATFPTTAGTAQPSSAGATDVFVTRLDQTGSSLVYSTYLGGSGSDAGIAVAIDATGSAYVTGATGSSDFPITPLAFQATNAGGGNDAFVARLDPTGSTLIYSTYLGGGSADGGHGIAVDAANNAYLTGSTASTDFPVTSGAAQSALAGGPDAFVTKVDPAGSALLYSSYLGGSSSDSGTAVAVDTLNNAYVTGVTSSADLPTTPGPQPTYAGASDAFVTKLNATASALVYSTYLGGSGNDTAGRQIAIDLAGNAYVSGQTASSDFPTTPGAFQPVYIGGTDAFAVKVGAAGSALIYSTYLGGTSFDFAFGLAIDGSGSAYVTGGTFSLDFPTTADAIQPALAGLDDVFVTKLNPAGSGILFSTYLGGAAFEFGSGIRLDGAGNAYVAGETSSNNFPATPGAFQAARAGNFEAFVAKIELIGAPATLTLSPATATNPVNTPHCVTATARDAGGNATPGVTVRFAVAGAVNTSDAATTDASGQASFCYAGPSTAGADTITAYADTNSSHTMDAGEPAAAATTIWFVPLPTTTNQCRNGGWQAFGIFKNQGDCVSFVASGGTNPPSGQ